MLAHLLDGGVLTVKTRHDLVLDLLRRLTCCVACRLVKALLKRRGQTLYWALRRERVTPRPSRVPHRRPLRHEAGLKVRGPGLRATGSEADRDGDRRPGTTAPGPRADSARLALRVLWPHVRRVVPRECRRRAPWPGVCRRPAWPGPQETLRPRAPGRGPQVISRWPVQCFQCDVYGSGGCPLARE